MSEPQSGSGHSLDKTPHQEQQQATAQAPPTSVEPVAPQDPQAQGAASGEKDQLLHSNVSGSEQEGAAEKANRLHNDQPSGNAGYHSTGSHTGSTGGQK